MCKMIDFGFTVLGAGMGSGVGGKRKRSVYNNVMVERSPQGREVGSSNHTRVIPKT